MCLTDRRSYFLHRSASRFMYANERYIREGNLGRPPGWGRYQIVFSEKWPNLLSGRLKIARHYIHGKLKFVIMN